MFEEYSQVSNAPIYVVAVSLTLLQLGSFILKSAIQPKNQKPYALSHPNQN